MEEIESIRCSLANEEYYTQSYRLFGWTLLSSQEINNQDSTVRVVGDYIVTQTTRIQYVKLTFKRDTNMPNYQRLCELQEEFESIPSNRYVGLAKGIVWGSIIAFIAICWIAAGIAAMAGGMPELGASAFIVGIVCIAFGVVISIPAFLIIFLRIRRKKRNDKKNIENNDRRDAIIDEACKLN